jgi:hypothetical protein
MVENNFRSASASERCHEHRRSRPIYVLLLLLFSACAVPVDSSGERSKGDDQLGTSLSALTQDSATSTTDSIPAGYVHVPGGWTHPSCVHEVPTGATVDDGAGTIELNGSVVERYVPCAYPAYRSLPSGTPAASTSGGAGNPHLTGPTYGGWVEYAQQQSPPSGQVFTDLSGYINVPPAPATQTPQTLYYFPGLQSTLDSNCGIMQPVVQWGVSPAGGGTFWAMASWWWSWSGAFHSPLVTVHSGEQIETYLVATGSCGTHCSTYLVETYDLTTNGYTYLYGNTSCRFNWAAVAAFEVDGGAPISNCNQEPAYTLFQGIGVWTGPQWTQQENAVGYSPTNVFPIGTNTPRCGWSISNGNAPGYGDYSLLLQ